MNDPYSRPLNQKSKDGLIAFLEDYLRSMNVTRADHQEALAKKRLTALLVDTDIDVLVIGMLFGVVYSPSGQGMLSTFLGAPNQPAAIHVAATAMVDILEAAIRLDKRMRSV